MKAPSIESVIGTWFIDDMPFDEEGILVITPEHRAVQFLTSITPPRMNQTMRLWAADDRPGFIRFRPSPKADGWLRQIIINTDGWSMIAHDDRNAPSFRCRPAVAADLPAWFAEQLERNLQSMRERESSGAQT